MEEQINGLKAIVLKPGESVVLPNVTLAAQLPNSYDLRGIDFGFSLIFTADETVVPSDPTDPPDPTDSPDPTDPPDTIDPTDPSHPTAPSDSVDPTDPPETTGPTDSVDPTDPLEMTEPSDPLDPSVPDKLEKPDDTPKTGDESRGEIWLALLVCASVLFFLVVARLRKEWRE